MEEWEQLLESYPESSDPKSFIKMLKTAEVVFKQDLASFESEWIISTLFYKPVNLLNTISAKHNDTSWTKPIGDAFKLIGSIVETYRPEHLYDHIATLCLLPTAPLVRKDGLSCLCKLTRFAAEGAQKASRLVAELQDAASCRAPLAVLVGVICEYHPEVVAESATRIWRIYLNLLDSNANTDTVIKAVLQGLLGLFKHFGVDLPGMELKDLYENISKDYVQKGKCEEVCLTILEEHSNLFKELLSLDIGLRNRLWTLKATKALHSVYETIATAVTREQLENIAATELHPRTSSPISEVKYTSLRILRRLSGESCLSPGLPCPDALRLEHQLRRGRVNLDTAEAIQWCLESRAPYSGRLLQASVLLFENIPVCKRDAIVNCWLDAPGDNRTATTTFLINECAQSAEALDRCLPLWRRGFESPRGALVFADVVDCLTVLLTQEGAVPPSLNSVLTVAAQILNMTPVEAYTEQACAGLLGLLARRGRWRRAGVLRAAAAAQGHCGGGLRQLCRLVRIDKCKDEALLCESCHLLVYAPEEDVDDEKVLMAVEVLLTRRDVEPKILSQAVLRLGILIERQAELDPDRLGHLLHLVEKLRTSNDKTGKDARILNRDLIFFMGKYGNNDYVNSQKDENTIIAELNDKLCLIIPNPDEVTSYKVNLQSILPLAISYEDPDVLQKLLSIICATLSTQKDPSLQLSLTLVIRALCRAHAHSSAVDPGSVQQAVMLCDSTPCLAALLTYISEEKSPGVRKMLSDALEGLLLLEPGSDAAEQLLRVAAERAAVMMGSDDPIVRSGGLNITETILSPLKENVLLQRNELPQILTLILETDDLDSNTTFKNAYKMLLDNKEIYNDETIKEIIEKLCKNMLKNYLDLSNDVDRTIYKDKIKSTIEFFNEFVDFDKEVLIKHCKMIDSHFDLKVYVMAVSGSVNDVIIEEVMVKVMGLKCFDDVFTVEALLKFFEVHSKEMLEKKREITLQALSNIIRNIPPQYIPKLKTEIKFCTSEYITDNQNFINDFDSWCQKFNMKDTVQNINKEDIQDENAIFLRSLNIYSDALKIPTFDDEAIMKLCDVTLDIYVENGEKYIEKYRNYVADMLEVSLRFKTLEKIKEFFKKSIEKAGIEFFKYFIDEFTMYLIRKPYILLEDDMKEVTVILNEILKNFLKKKSTEDDCVKILELIDTVWPIYESKASLEAKQSLLLYLTKLPVQLHGETATMRSVVELMVKEGIGENVELLRVLPGGESCSPAYRALTSGLPARLSELSGCSQAALQSLLDCVEAHADSVPLDIVMKLAACDPTKDWWDEAMASCMAVIARRGDFTLSRLRVTPDGAVVEKHEVSPMRYSTPSFCEKFYSKSILGLLSDLARWERGREEYRLRRRLRTSARALSLITLALEKIPLASLKSPDSFLYSEVELKQPSYLIRKANALCVTLRKKTCPEDASDELKESYRQMQIENYKCLCAAVCITRPAAHFYDFLFDAQVWQQVFDCDVVWDLPLRSHWSQQKTVHTVADASTESTRAGSSTARSRLFLKTLSENPLLFDLMDGDEEPLENSQEIELTVNELNSQECADTLTALLRHAAALAHVAWRDTLVHALVGPWPRNVKWTVAQMICNCKNELKPHSTALGPALIQLVADTPKEDNEKKFINNLHFEVLETILHWGEVPADPAHLSLAIEYLINACIEEDKHVGERRLVQLFGKLLDVYGTSVIVSWSCFEGFLNVPDKLKTILRILLITTKHKIHIPELLPSLMTIDKKLWKDIKVPEVFGYALACASEIAKPLNQFRHFLDRKRQADVGEYIKMLYYAQIGYPKICDEFNFKKILDLTSKVSGASQSKCLSIIAAQTRLTGMDSLEDLDLRSLLLSSPVEAMAVVEGLAAQGRTGRDLMAIVAPYCSHSDVTLRDQAMKVMLKSFEAVFGADHGSAPDARRRRICSALLGSLQSDDTRVVQCVALAVAAGERERVAACLSEDMKMRLAECFLLAICIPATSSNKNRSLSVCADAFLDLLFRRLRAQERFKEAKLREEPLEISDPSMLSLKLFSNTRTYQGTFLSSMGRRPRAQGPTFSGINVQIPIEEILGTLLAFAKDKPDVSLTLCAEISRAILASGRGFDPAENLSQQICDVLSATPGNITPMAVEAARLIVGDVSSVLSFKPSLEKLRKLTISSEGEGLVQLLIEESRLRSDPDVLQLGITFEYDQTMDVEPSLPSLEALTSAFGSLSNWDRLTEQQRDQICSGLPQLWVEEDIFSTWLERYQVLNTKSWFNKLVSSYRDECKQDSLRWLRETDRWPRRQFDTAVVIDAIERQDWSERDGRLCEIKPTDCLVEWAARLMLRRAFASSNDSDASEVTSSNRLNELEWCKAANERGLPHLTLNCINIKGSLSSLDPGEQLSWRIEMIAAMRDVGLRSHDVDMLGEALALLESNPILPEDSFKSDIIAMNKLTLALHQDLGSLSDVTVTRVMETIGSYTKTQVNCKRDKHAMGRLFEIAMNYYDDVWTDDVTEQNKLLSNMADVLGHVIDLDLPGRAEMFLAVILNKLDDVTTMLEEETAGNLLEKITLILPTLDDTSLDQISGHQGLFPSELVSGSSLLKKRRYTLPLRPAPDRALLKSVGGLRSCCQDAEGWRKAFDLMRESIFECPDAGNTEYVVLNKYKHELYQIEDYDTTDSKQKTIVINKIMLELNKKVTSRSTLRLSQLCPALAKYTNTGCERDDDMSRVLGLGKLGVVKFYDQVQVFTDAETRPMVLTVLLSNGTTRRYIHKTGDRLKLDAAALRVAGGASRLWGGHVLIYSVTPLGEDSGLIEYVEHTQRLRTLVNAQFDLAEVDIGARVEDEELILASSSLEHHMRFCRQVPPFALRSAIAASCFSTEDFINKKQTYLETLTVITIFSWIFGLGDRHLENILYSVKTGGLCCVDWAAMFQYGVRELPPARLTRNLLAVCDLQAFEVSLQRLVKSLRNSHKIFLHYMRGSFKWMGEEFSTKFPYIQAYARGRATSRDVTRQALLASSRRYKERIVSLLDSTFADLEVKDRYSVVEQVTCLLRQCTNEKILSVTRSGWEPWV